MHIGKVEKNAAQRGENIRRKMSETFIFECNLERYMFYSVLNHSESIDMQTF